ncbi:MAG: histidine phosphotransferase family protein [Alkalilacustris sp.]
MKDILPPGHDKNAADQIAPDGPSVSDLDALVASRICHDLTNPLGAIGNGLELLELTGATDSPEMALIAQSVAQAKARVQFLRVAFGAASAGHRMGGAELARMVADHTTGGRTAVRWLCPDEVPRIEARLAFLLLMCVETALPFGGEIEVQRSDAAWHLLARTTRIRDLGDLWDGLSGRMPLPHLGPPQVHFALAVQTARTLHRPITVDLGTEHLTLSA